jgi:tetratricopeptide (TPR) repeat protein
MSNQFVKAWVEKVNIPTYGIGKPEKNPIFFEKRVYQGSSGTVYPHPVVEKILDEKKDKEYIAVFIENEYLKIMILPELGGRVQRAYDKIRQRDFVYYNRVIKPALVGLTGPWISGGIEFNWPQHHRPSTFNSLDFTIKENSDGSKTVWVNEVELMSRTKGMAGFTLYPNKAYLEIKGRIYNRTPFPQTFLWWANPAVKVNEHYQSVFPPDVYAVFDHGKRDVSDFPISTRTYYKVNYAPGTDISRYKNIPVPTSYMAINSKYDFIGCYEHDTQTGMLHVADHHISPGKKQWTWGYGDFGQAWDRNLTDEDGPYIELMAGMFTDNQPDFSWLQPNEEKTFEQYFMPYAKIGMVKNATKEAMVSLEINDKKATIKVYVTATYKNAVVSLFTGDELADKSVTNLSPADIFEKVVSLNENIAPENIKVQIEDADGQILVSYQPDKLEKKEVPPPASAAKAPAEIRSSEELYLNGLHIEQYRHATYTATDYYEEALRREPTDIRNNNVLGLWYLRRGQFIKAELYFRAAIKTSVQKNPNPYDGEPFYNLGWSLKMQGRLNEAYDAFYKATWNAGCQEAGYFALARIAAAKKDYENALYVANKSLLKNYHGHSVRHLISAMLRKLNRHEEAHTFLEESLVLDPFNYGCLFEKYLLSELENNKQEAAISLTNMQRLMRSDAHNYIEYGLDYAHAGLYDEAIQLLKVYCDFVKEENPMIYYYTGWYALQLGNEDEEGIYFKKAASASPDFCFPHRLEDIIVLQSAIKRNPADAKAYYYLGNLWYDKRQYNEAIACWEKSALLDDKFPTVHRNLSLAYQNKLQDEVKSLTELEKAFALDESDARVLMELDQLYKKTGRLHKERLALLEKHLPLVEYRDDLYLERVVLYNQIKKYFIAKELISQRQFHPWEGGEGKVVGQYLLSHIGLAKQAIMNKEYQQALDLLNATEHYPHNLGEGKLYGTQENDIHYLQGCAYERLGFIKEAKEKFIQSVTGISQPVQANFYNDPQPDKIFYQGLAWLKLDEPDKAKRIFERLIQFGNEHLYDEIRIDYFAVSLPDLLVFDQDLNLKNKIHCKYMVGLGCLGLGIYDKAGKELEEVLAMEINHQGAQVHIDMMGFLKSQLKQTQL